MIHDWTRFWTKPDGQISLADQGFLVAPPDESWLASASPDLWRFEEIAARRCLILLGEPGMGKSQALEAEVQAVAASRGERTLVLQVDLGATREESVLREEIFGSPQFRDWLRGEQELHLFLDSLDEAVLRLGVVGDIILKGLANADVGRLWLRLACRTADRLPEFEATLRNLWREEESGAYELAPLRRADVRLAASDRGLDPISFVQGLVEQDVVPFAIKPITLAMLLDLAGEAEGLPHSQLELYDRGLRHLVAEPGERRSRDLLTRGGLSVGKRLAVARRIAGATIVSGRPSIATTASAHGTRNTVTLAQLDGGNERDSGAAVPTSFEINEDGLREALDTGLFSARGDLLGWAHQTYGEYLAAGYLTGTEIPLEQILALLVAEDDDRRVVPQLRDVAGWAAAMDPAVLDELAARDPLVLLRGDVTLAADAQKAQLTDALLRTRPAQELDLLDRRNRRNLRALMHDGMETTLRSRLTDRDESPPVRLLACQLAQICEIHGLQDDLVQLALAPEEPVRLRSAAARALQAFADDEARGRLLPLARDELPEDPDDELKGTALAAVCPSVIKPGEVLSFLTAPKNTSLTGAYASFLWELAEALEEDELPAALEWVRRQPRSHDAMDDLATLCEKIVIRGVERMSRDDVRAALVEVVAEYLEAHYDLQSFRTRDNSNAFTDDDHRHRLMEELLPRLRDGRLEPLSLVTSTPSLLTGNDLPWLTIRLADAVGSEDETIWAELIDWALKFEGADLDLVMDARKISPLLCEQTRARFGPIELDSPLADQLRDWYRRELQWAKEERQLAEEAPDFDAEIDSLLDRFESGDPDAFWQLNIAIWGERGSRSLLAGGSDLTSSPGWQRATPDRRARIGAAAAPYLRLYEPSQEWLTPTKRYHPASAGYRALRYLADHEPERFDALGADTLCRWIPAILTFTHSAGDEHEDEFSDRLVCLVASLCVGELIAATRELLMAEAEHGEGHLFILSRVRPALSGALGSSLLGLWRTSHLRSQPYAQLMRALLDAHVDGATAAALEAVDADGISADSERARRLAAALLGAAAPSAWNHLWPLLNDHTAWGAEVFEELAGDWDRRDFRTGLSEEQLCDLYLWLAERFPPDQDPSLMGAHFIGSREEVAEYRDQVLRPLIMAGSAEALAAIDRIEAATGRDMAYVRIQAEEAWRIQRWTPPRPEDVVALAANAQRRIVLSGGDLQRVVLQALLRIQEMLGPQGQAHQVWDTTARRPKAEPEIAAWIADRLRDHLRGRGIIINREVEVRVNPRGGVGDRTDIHIDAIAGERVEGAERVTVIVEVKGCWHDELLTAMRGQLAQSYLSPASPHGIYLCVWFGPNLWEDTNDRRRRACEQLRKDWFNTLETQAAELRGEQYEIVPVMIDASLR